KTALCTFSKSVGFPTCPVREPGLPEAVTELTSEGVLSHIPSLRAERSNPRTTRYFWMAVDTRVNDRDEVDVQPLEKLALHIGEFRGNAEALIVSSQIPRGFSKRFESLSGLPVVYVPENLRLGKGL